MKGSCPNCKGVIEFQSTSDFPYFPFCCERCRLLDLGKWMDGSYKVTRGLSEEELMDLPPEDWPTGEGEET